MAAEAGRVGRGARRDRQGDTLSRRRMADRAIYPRMPVMCESGSKAPKAGKSFHPGARMTDRTDRTLVVAELESVAPGTREVARTARKADPR
jgi:hypothetical protein